MTVQNWLFFWINIVHAPSKQEVHASIYHVYIDWRCQHLSPEQGLSLLFTIETKVPLATERDVQIIGIQVQDDLWLRHGPFYWQVL
jgi:hypothetical protein